MAGDYRFPNWPCVPTKPAVFDDRSLAEQRDCPWAWPLAFGITAIGLAVVFLW